MRRAFNWLSLKFASTQSWSSATTVISGAPACTRWPSCTLRLATWPASGACRSTRCKASRASRTRAAARSTFGCWSTLVPSVWVRLASSWSRAAWAADWAAASALRAAANCAVMCWNSSWPTAPLATSGLRRLTSSCARARSARARARSASRRRICAPRVLLLANRLRTSRRVCASWASACSSATRASAGSSRTRVWPARTLSVSSASMAMTVPLTCGVICTTWPAT